MSLKVVGRKKRSADFTYYKDMISQSWIAVSNTDGTVFVRKKAYWSPLVAKFETGLKEAQQLLSVEGFYIC